jgi:hypothetical protein
MNPPCTHRVNDPSPPVKGRRKTRKVQQMTETKRMMRRRVEWYMIASSTLIPRAEMRMDKLRKGSR